jgi:DNA-binding GntR family transcriptional regulator
MLELIQPISKRDQVVNAMKAAILSGTIEPGASIVESKIAQQLGAGVPLIREALIELEHQGFVQELLTKERRLPSYPQPMSVASLPCESN